MSIPYIINIQKYSIHDGDGIRTTIFFKGCQLKCWWCHNPESQVYSRQIMFNKEKCVGCGICVERCPHHAISISDETHVALTDKSKCDLCETCIDYCVYNNREIVGKQYSIKELVKIVKQDQMFYEESGGGVTLSGGEVMSQDIDYLEELVKQLKYFGFNVTIDTCGFAPQSNFERLLPYVDTFLYDIKTMDEATHIKYMGQSSELILNNLRYLSKNNANINIRIPLVEPVNTSDKDILAMIKFLKEEINCFRINLLPYHNTGSSKYEKLGRDYPAKDLCTPSDERLEKIKDMFISAGFTNVKIGG